MSEPVIQTTEVRCTFSVGFGRKRIKEEPKLLEKEEGWSRWNMKQNKVGEYKIIRSERLLPLFLT